MVQIPTTHAGSLPRPSDLATLLIQVEAGGAAEGLELAAEVAVGELVAHQRAIGLTVVNDGEAPKPSYANYVKHRLGGFDGEDSGQSNPAAANDEFPDLATTNAGLAGRHSASFPACTGPIVRKDPGATTRDVERLLKAARAAGVAPSELFMSAASPGLIVRSFRNEYFPDRESYLAAVIDAMRDEYREIIAAGFVLQLDCPDLASTFGPRYPNITVEQFRTEAAESIAAMNTAVADLPSEQMRIHVCWGNYEAPHNHDIELADLFDVLFEATPAGISLEAANPRHGHEWQLFERVALPADKYLIPGVIDTTTNFIEHPEVVAQRIARYVDVVGPERVVAGTDCGFATFVGPRRVAPSVAWAKLSSLVAGARLLSS